MAKSPTLKEVREAHARYGDATSRWGEDNQATISAMVRYWDLRRAYEAGGREYRP